MYRRICLTLLAFASPAFGAELPIKTTVTTVPKIEIMRDGKVSGSIDLPVGAKLDPTHLAEAPRKNPRPST
jgi:hypothetical protein